MTENEVANNTDVVTDAGRVQVDLDQQYETYAIESAEADGDAPGWTLRFREGSCIWLTAANCDVAPRPGEKARLYGKGFGFRVRGIAIDGRVYRYRTTEEDAADHEAWCAQWRADQAAAEKKHRAEIAAGRHAPVAFRIKEPARADYEKGLANNTDPYGRRCYTYAAQWASLMEKEIAAGKTVAAIAKETSHAADTDGVTGFMYGCAVSILAHRWEHGEDLRQWHNGGGQ